MKVSIYYWQFYDGISRFDLPNSPRGWFCWAYPDSDREFEAWMKENCPTAEVTHRFNSGDPMYTVFIPHDDEAKLFKETFMKEKK